MSIQPEGESLRRAVTWISQQRKEYPDKKSFTLAESACLKFDLTPAENEFLSRFIQDSLKK